jgi:hypothetical protein
MNELQIKWIMKHWKLHKGLIAAKSGINEYTFGMKLKGAPNYKFTDAELHMITEALLQLSRDIVAIIPPK